MLKTVVITLWGHTEECVSPREVLEPPEKHLYLPKRLLYLTESHMFLPKKNMLFRMEFLLVQPQQVLDRLVTVDIFLFLTFL